eukprot:CAMPEP_0198586116 /NCGR_PEP_ID=MMETSP1462-20131121/130194_1 /TAXON_ID=1333877 /ORGANISM="Brandtodinium nutriculum, Strain RCC3387" /LENGTH=64 /DNA_ID=CAMNT_0044317561 /DNA_START=106 /DNA_END=297 /DNA_ORIENTATION=+
MANAFRLTIIAAHFTLDKSVYIDAHASSSESATGSEFGAKAVSLANLGISSLANAGPDPRRPSE